MWRPTPQRKCAFLSTGSSKEVNTSRKRKRRGKFREAGYSGVMKEPMNEIRIQVPRDPLPSRSRSADGSRGRSLGGTVSRFPPPASLGAACPPGTTFAQTFRWCPRSEKSGQPRSVAVVGSLTRWRPVPLTRTPDGHAWQVIIQGIPGNRTHCYSLLLDGIPTFDDACDGFVVPKEPEEERYQFDTRQGPRLCLLFANAK